MPFSIEFPQNQNYYELLGLAPDANQEDILHAYRQLSLIYHPASEFRRKVIGIPVTPVEVESFRLITRAFKALSDEVTKEAYDRRLQETLTETQLIDITDYVNPPLHDLHRSHLKKTSERGTAGLNDSGGPSQKTDRRKTGDGKGVLGADGQFTMRSTSRSEALERTQQQQFLYHPILVPDTTLNGCGYGRGPAGRRAKDHGRDTMQATMTPRTIVSRRTYAHGPLRRRHFSGVECFLKFVAFGLPAITLVYAGIALCG